MQEQTAGGIRLVTPAMHRLLQIAGLLVFLAGIQLFVFPEKTEDYFAWTIQFPLTAAFLGAAYWASVMFEWGAARERVWANARVGIPAVFVFTAMTFIATMLHLDLFHLDAALPLRTRLVTYGWIAVYGSVPVLMLALIAGQLNAPGEDPPRTKPLPVALRALLAFQGAVLLVLGVALFAAPETTAEWWAWPLTPLTARAVAAWLLGVGVAAVHSVFENDLARVKIAAQANVALVVLELVARLRYWKDVPASAERWAYDFFLLLLLAGGLFALAGAREPSPSRNPAT